jgi:outer membrane protein assembly factor BamE (lipoprotein component of BamABCDE complex)
MKKSKRTIFLGATFVVVMAALLTLSNLWFRQPEQSVLVGDSKEDVLRKLGKPSAIFTNVFDYLKYGGEVWAYGRELDLRAAIRGEFPFKLRIFAPDENDIVIIFDSSGRVKQIQTPKK